MFFSHYNDHLKKVFKFLSNPLAKFNKTSSQSSFCVLTVKRTKNL